MLEMVVHLVFHVEDNTLGYPRVYITFQHAYDLGGGEGHKGHDKKLYKKLHIPPHQRLVHYAPGDYRGEKTYPGGEQNGDEDEEKLKGIGLEIGEYAQYKLL